MQDLRITTRLGKKLGFVGIFFGAWSGFLLRDEYIYPTNEKIKELEQSYIENTRNINFERDQLKRELTEIEKKAKEMKLQRELKKKQAKETLKKTQKTNKNESGLST